MPAQDGARLNDDQSLPPRAQLASQEDDEGAVAPGEFGVLDLSLQDNQLLTEESILQHQFRLGAGHIQDGIPGQGMVVRLGPLMKRLCDNLPERNDTSLGEGKDRKAHGLPFSWKMKP